MKECGQESCSYCNKDFAEALSCPHHIEVLKEIESRAAAESLNHREHPEQPIEEV